MPEYIPHIHMRLVLLVRKPQQGPMIDRNKHAELDMHPFRSYGTSF